MYPRSLGRVVATGVVAAAVFIASASNPRAQAVPEIDKRITYILPQWLNFLSADGTTLAQQVQELHSRIGNDGPRVRLGFTTYIDITMSPVDPTDTAAVQAALASTFSQMDSAIARARANNIPICLSFLTAVREAADSLQTAAQAEDRRDMQWRSDNTMADGWTTFSRYARKQEAIQEAYIRELGRQLAARMLANPDILVGASGDGEIELASPDAGTDAQGNRIIADYSPFVVAEFRDWLRGSGLYAAGQPFAGEAYATAARYAGDTGLATLNSDFGLSFQNWNLKYFDWSLADAISPDPHAIPSSVYGSGTFNATPGDNPGGFDPPREHQRGNAWSDLWDQFRATMVWRHNREFAKWITTSADPATGATVPPDRWYTDQIPADYLFGSTPANPNERFDTSASAIWTADASPYGSLGITSFNVNFGTTYAKTLAGAAPVIAARKVRWGVFEWNPSVPPSADISVYRDEMVLVKTYRPSLLAPFVWQAAQSGITDLVVEDTPFESALRQLVIDLDNVPLTLSRSKLDIGATTTGTSTPPQVVRVGGAPGESPAWTATASDSSLDLVTAADGRSFSVALKPGTYPAGTVTSTITVTPSEPGYAAATLSVTVTVSLPGTTHPPLGAVDTPVDNATVSGEVAVTGWAVDDVGLASVAVCRAPMTGEPQNPAACGGQPLVFIGNAAFVSGARPDVLAQFPDQPMNDQAGWGYMLMSNMLPNGGTGTFTLSIVASDVDGHSVVIASRTIVAQNATATIPFGTIDTPGQGATVSGTVVNFGWALSRTLIPFDGSTIDVLVDGVVVGHPAYGYSRADIDALFPGYPNSGHAVGAFVLDTTTLTNGVHSIAWIVRDIGGGTQGVGSRFFTVANP
jgi:hypothetical protein